jgi:hypothetical protein
MGSFERDDDDSPGARPAFALPPSVDCRKLVSLITDYVDGELPKEVSQQIDTHMGMCAPCVAFMREYKFAGEAARRVLIKQVPDGLEERLLSFLKGRCKKG